MITAKVIFPDFKEIPEKVGRVKGGFFREAKWAIIRDIIDGIDKRVDITGRAFLQLEQSTIKRKGHDRQLIDDGYLIDEKTYRYIDQYKIGKATLTIQPWGKPTPRDLVGVYLQIEGVASKHGKKKYPFFGVSKKASMELVTLFEFMVKKELKI